MWMARSEKCKRARANKRRAAQIEQIIAAGGVAAAEDRAWLMERKAARWKSMRGAAQAKRHYLQVPYAEKDDAKALGARWDADRRQWWVPGHVPLAPFVRWHPAPSKAETRKARKRAKEHAETRMQRQENDQWLYGTLGAAGPVRHIDPKDYRP
jgi:hypothetical protein